MVTQFVTELDQHPIVVERPHRTTSLIGATKVYDEASGVLEHSMGSCTELGQPIDVIVLRLVPVGLLALERKGRRGDDEVYGSFFHSVKKRPAVPADLSTQCSRIDDLGRIKTV
jgi:hypothetical protein